jgi:hypothetical protein
MSEKEGKRVGGMKRVECDDSFANFKFRNFNFKIKRERINIYDEN